MPERCSFNHIIDGAKISIRDFAKNHCKWSILLESIFLPLIILATGASVVLALLIFGFVLIHTIYWTGLATNYLFGSLDFSSLPWLLFKEYNLPQNEAISSAMKNGTGTISILAAIVFGIMCAQKLITHFCETGQKHAASSGKNGVANS